MGSWLSQSSEGVLLQRWSMKLAQLHWTHMSGEEGLSQLQCRNRVLLQGQKMDLVCSILYTLYLHFLVSWLYFYFTDSKSKQLKHLFIVYLNNVATKSPPETLLFWIVELIIGEVPWVLYFRLGHILTIQTSQFLVWIRFKQIWKSKIGTSLTLTE